MLTHEELKKLYEVARSRADNFKIISDLEKDKGNLELSAYNLDKHQKWESIAQKLDDMMQQNLT